MFAEHRLAIHEFTGVEVGNAFERQLVEKLKEPTRKVAQVYRLVADPPQWYRGVFSGSFDDSKELEEFKKEFNRRVSDNPLLRDPYAFIDEKWQARSIIYIRGVRFILRSISEQLREIIPWIKSEAMTRVYSTDFADYISFVRDALPNGEFDSITVEALKLPTALRVGWLPTPQESYDDPLGIKRSPQAFLTYTDWGATTRVNRDIALYNRASRAKFEYPLIPAKAYVDYMIIASGWLGAGDRNISGFNIPNDPQVSERAGNTMIRVFPQRISAKNSQTLSPASERLYGVGSSNEDVQPFVLAHEVSHGVRPKGEAERLGGMRAPVREGWANRRSLVLASSPFFAEDYCLKVCRGLLAYSASDIGSKIESVIFEPYGRNQPTLDQIIKESPYAVDAYLLIRRAFLERAIRSPIGSIDFNKILRISEEMDSVYENIARNGTEESAQRTLENLIDRRRGILVGDAIKKALSLFRINKAAVL